MSSITTVAVLGTGVLGAQIAFQTAFHGYRVHAYDINEEALDRARTRFAELAGIYQHDPAVGAAAHQTEAALQNLHLTTDLAEAVGDADLVIEAVPEKIEVKRRLYTELADLAPSRTIFATNSSTLLPSDLKDFTGRPGKFLALHYANHVWRQNTAEVMGTTDTDPAVYETVVDFARNSGMVPVELKKEKAGYVLNSLLVPLLDAASGLLVEGIADHETIDKTWRIATGAPLGPFQIFDIVGLTTAYNIASTNPSEKSQEFAAMLKRDFIDRGHLGTASGQGFYTY
ncbi:3-hydroxyacyl-CoA dehydrogenase [Arthrobacter rhombi]|uniref:3-hydroxyacyl-CoA dehydrogenase n=1 Tax=Arthrobacter rhombi TaxID=71253 RepID=UPI0031DA9CC0